MKALSHNLFRPIYLVAVLFFAKAILLAFWVTPLWDITDEVGHYSYALDLAEGRGVPLLGEAVIGKDVLSDLRNVPRASVVPEENWIAQHPPVYYWLAAIPLRVGLLCDVELDTLYRLPRIIAALSGALLLIVLYHTALLIGLGPGRSLSLAAIAGCIPSFTHLSSGTSHDVTLFLFAALATHFWVKFMLYGNVRSAFACTVWMALAAGTKLTALVLLAPMVCTIIIELRGSWFVRIRHAVTLIAVSMSIASYWLIRNVVHFSNPFYTSTNTTDWSLQVPLDLSVLEFLERWPAIEHFVLNYLGVFGWLGSGGGNYRVFQLRDGPLLAFSILLLAVCVLLAVQVIRSSWSGKAVERTEREASRSVIECLTSCLQKKWVRRILTFSFFVAACVLGYQLFQISYMKDETHEWMRLLSVCLLLFTAVHAVSVIINSSDRSNRIMAYGCLIFMFFSAVVLWEVYQICLLDGRMRATWGRYLYPVAPALMMAIGVALKKLNVGTRALVVTAIIVVYFELETFVGQVMTFYAEGI